MTKLIDKDDPLWFGQTCDKPYDRHHYKIVCQDKSFVVESWDEVQEYYLISMSKVPSKTTFIKLMKQFVTTNLTCYC